ncbi:hypothetical protein APHAL10511_005966 [Amanita phalloides]|nr:hypothetical protein APHAL10511_005966 [Amanita phalloides]
MQEFDDWYYPLSSPESSNLSTNTYMNPSQKPVFTGDAFDASHNLYTYNNLDWKMHYPPQTHAMVPASKIRSSTEGRPYNREHISGITAHQPPPDASRIPSMASADASIPIVADVDRSPASNDSFSSGDREINSWMYWGSSSPLYNPSPSQSSDATSSPSPPSPLPSMPAQPPLIIHQPRPYRRIPIVSLSQLASACEEFDNRPPQQNTLSPLPFEYLDFNFDPSSTGIHQPLTHPPFPPSAAAAFNAYRSPMMLAKTSDRTILCPCGCMGHYICS